VFTIQSSASGSEGAMPSLTIGRRQRTRPEQSREPARDAASLRLRVVNSTENMTKDPEKIRCSFPVSRGFEDLREHVQKFHQIDN
jgi:hypothetical protein